MYTSIAPQYVQRAGATILGVVADEEMRKNKTGNQKPFITFHLLTIAFFSWMAKVEKGNQALNKKRKRSRKVCYHCKSESHRGKECPNAVCRICEEAGHDAGGCRMKPLMPVNLGKFKGLEQRKKSSIFTYCELFAGMGGFRLALDKLGGTCVFASEVDRFCVHNYELNFGDAPAGDICRIGNEQIPDHDFLVGGFPCQPFSSSGSRLGVDDPRGLLFREIVRILGHKQPRIFLLENVRGLYLNNNGNTLQQVVKELEACGYDVKYELLDAVKLLPQERCRLFLVGIRQDLQQEKEFQFPILPNLQRGIEDIIQLDRQDELEKLILNPNQLSKVKAQKYTQEHPEARFLSNLKLPAKTIQSSYMKYMVGSQFIPIGNDWRRFSSREVARLQGFPEGLQLCQHRAHHMVGNAVSPPVIAMIAAPLLEYVQLCPNLNDHDVAWGWNITKTMLLEAAPDDSRRKALVEKLSYIAV
jgi:DNA (cytosine-5)-methyltransferase 1